MRGNASDPLKLTVSQVPLGRSAPPENQNESSSLLSTSLTRHLRLVPKLHRPSPYLSKHIPDNEDAHNGFRGSALCDRAQEEVLDNPVLGRGSGYGRAPFRKLLRRLWCRFKRC